MCPASFELESDFFRFSLFRLFQLSKNGFFIQSVEMMSFLFFTSPELFKVEQRPFPGKI